jgi:UDP-2,3-diacylglucosamine hydrolase
MAGSDLHAPAEWRSVDIISDLHLHPAESATLQAWRSYLLSTSANALFILGDLFEVWVGDDVLDDPTSFESQCASALKAASARMDIFIMHGNRDFLMGSGLMLASQATLLEDPTVLVFANERTLLTHGDALCLADLPYMEFRRMVRSPQWQQDFLAKPLVERQAVARHLRDESEKRKRSQVPTEYVDLDSDAVRTQLMAHQAKHMIHGHTHRPAEHALGNGYIRTVLSDWDLAATPARAEVLRMSIAADSKLHIQRISPLNGQLP